MSRTSMRRRLPAVSSFLLLGVVGTMVPGPVSAFSPPGECRDIGDDQTIDQTNLEEHWNERPYLFDLFTYDSGESHWERLWSLTRTNPTEPWAGWYGEATAAVDPYLDVPELTNDLTTAQLAEVAKSAAFLYRLHMENGESAAALPYAVLAEAAFDSPDFRCDTGRWTGTGHYLTSVMALEDFAIAFDLMRDYWYGQGGDRTAARKVAEHLFVAAQDFYIEGVCNSKNYIDLQENNWTIVAFSSIGTTMLSIAGVDCRGCDNGSWTCFHGDPVNFRKMHDRSVSEVRQAIDYQITRDSGEDGAIGLLGWAEGSNYYTYSCAALLPYQIAFDHTVSAVDSIVPVPLLKSSPIFDDAELTDDFYYTVLFDVLSQNAGGDRPQVDDSHRHGFYSAYLAGIYREIYVGNHVSRLGARDYQGVPTFLLLDWDARRQAVIGFDGPAVENLLLFRDNRGDYVDFTGNTATQFVPPLRTAVFGGHAGGGILRSGWGDDDLSLYLVSESGKDWDRHPFSDGHEQPDGHTIVARAHGSSILIDGGYGAYDCRDRVNDPDNHSTIVAENGEGGYQYEGFKPTRLSEAMGSGCFPDEVPENSLAWIRSLSNPIGFHAWRYEHRSVWMLDDRFWLVGDEFDPISGSFDETTFAHMFHGPTLFHDDQDPVFNRGVWSVDSTTVGIHSAAGHGVELVEIGRKIYEHEERTGCDFDEHYASVARFRCTDWSRPGMIWSVVYPMASGEAGPSGFQTYGNESVFGFHISDSQSNGPVDYFAEFRTAEGMSSPVAGVTVDTDGRYAITKTTGSGFLSYFMAADVSRYEFGGLIYFESVDGDPVSVYLDRSGEEAWTALLSGLHAGSLYRLALPFAPPDPAALEVSPERTTDVRDRLEWSWDGGRYFQFALDYDLPEGAYLALSFPGVGRIDVPVEIPMIQGAIDAALDGQTVVVQPGVYRESGIRFRGKRLVLRSTNPADPSVVQSTVIDGMGAGTVLEFSSGEGPETVCAGLTITGGLGSGWPDDTGGAMTMRAGTSPTIDRCVFSENLNYSECDPWRDEPDTRGYGGAVYASGASPLFTNCIFVGNRADRGGAGCFVGGAPRFVNTYLLDNVAGGLCAELCHGGALYLTDSDATILNCTMAGNRAEDDGPAVYGWGGSMELVNSIVWDHAGAPLALLGTRSDIRYSDIQGGAPGEGNIDAPPRFDSDRRLTLSSPCRDRASSEAAPPTDFEGESRGEKADMGADEFSVPVIRPDFERANLQLDN